MAFEIELQIQTGHSTLMLCGEAKGYSRWHVKPIEIYFNGFFGERMPAERKEGVATTLTNDYLTAIRICSFQDENFRWPHVREKGWERLHDATLLPADEQLCRVLKCRKPRKESNGLRELQEELFQ